MGQQQLFLSSGSSLKHNSRQFNRLSVYKVEEIGKNEHLFKEVDVDMRHFEQMYLNNQGYKQIYKLNKIVKSSKDEQCLLSRSVIEAQIISFFSDQRIAWKCLYFSGIGTIEGYLQLQTTQHPEGQVLTICQLVQMWRKFRSTQNMAQLQIFLDCNYSGKIVHEYSQIENAESLDNIVIYASSGPENKSLYVSRFGGLLICSWWAKLCPEQLTQIEHQELKQKFESRNPISVTWNKEKKCKEIKELKWLFNLYPIIEIKPSCGLI